MPGNLELKELHSIAKSLNDIWKELRRFNNNYEQVHKLKRYVENENKE